MKLLTKSPNSFEDGAETKCEDAITKSLSLDANNIESLQTLASLRISQCRQDEACLILQKVFDRFHEIIENYRKRRILDDLQHSADGIEDNFGKFLFRVFNLFLLPV